MISNLWLTSPCSTSNPNSGRPVWPALIVSAGYQMLKNFSFLTMTVFACSVLASHQEVGQVAISGQIIEPACAIATDDIWQEINFGKVALKDIKSGNVETKLFFIHFLNCSLVKDDHIFWSSVQIAFDGNRNPDNPSYFNMRGDGAGVSLTIKDEYGNRAKAGELLSPVELSGKNVDLKFKLDLVGNGETLSAGDVSSLIRFMVAYQ